MVWECDSCPDLYHGQDKVQQCEEDDYLNTSFPGLNQEHIDPKEKCIELMQFFNKMAEEDAQRERDNQERLIR